MIAMPELLLILAAAHYVEDLDKASLIGNGGGSITCCGATPCSRATSITRAPGPKLSATIRALAASVQLRRPVGPDITSSRSKTLPRPANKIYALSCKAVVPSAANHDANGSTDYPSRQSDVNRPRPVTRLDRERQRRLRRDLESQRYASKVPRLPHTHRGIRRQLGVALET